MAKGLPEGTGYKIAFKAMFQVIPWVGSPLSTLIFRYRDEVRLKRIEDTLSELADELKGLPSDRFADFEEHDKSRHAQLIEEWLDVVEKDVAEENKEYLKNYFKNSHIRPTTSKTFDERRIFLQILKLSTKTELEVLAELVNECKSRRIKEFTLESFLEIKMYEEIMPLILGRLESNGLVMLRRMQTGLKLGGSHGMSGTPNIEEVVQVTVMAFKFVEFCLKDPNNINNK